MSQTTGAEEKSVYPFNSPPNLGISGKRKAWLYMLNSKNMVCIISSIVMLILVADASVLSFLLYGILGICLGLIEIATNQRQLKDNWITKLIIIIISLLLVYEFGKIFYHTWLPSSLVHSLLSKLIGNTDFALFATSVILSMIAIPAAIGIVSILLGYCEEMALLVIREFSLKKVLFNEDSFIKSIKIIIENLLIAVAIGVVLLGCVYSLPTSNIEKNVQKSAEVLVQEGKYPTVFSGCVSQLDNFTDSLMLNEAAYDTEGSSIEKAMKAYRGRVNDEDSFDSLISHYILKLDYTSKASYSRYWHGCQIILKPLLLIMDYSGIRVLNFVIQILLLTIIVGLMVKCKFNHFILPYICSYLMMMPITLGKSLQFSSCYYIFSCGVIALLLLPEKIKNKNAYVVFLNVGIATAYFDFLTYPIATFGVLSAIYLAIQNKDFSEQIGDLIKNGFSWCIGFGGMWASKWIVAYILTGYNTFTEVENAFAIRVSNTNWDGSSVSKLSCVLMNYNAFWGTPFKYLCILYAIYIMIKIVKLKNSNKKETLTRAFAPFSLIALAPMVWFAFATNHSTVHYWFTNKACVVTVMAVLFGLVNIYEKCSIEKIPEKENNNG